MKIPSSKLNFLSCIRTTLLVVVFLSVLLFGTNIKNVFADGPALDVGDPHGGSVFRQGTYSLGWRFTANGPLIVTALGIFDDNKDGLNGSHEVGLYDASDCNLLRRVTVTPSDGRIGFFRYHKIDALALVGSKDYYVAAVTNDDNYLYNPTTITTDGLITFGGFAIYGNTQTTSELKCPNGSASSPGIKGDFGPNFYIGTVPSIIDNPTSGNDPTKRDTALTVFCNRSGPTLGTAKCTATVSDTGAPTRTLPTGTIDWVATDGFVPASASCNPTQVGFSPGVGSCEAEFTVPAGFSIGTKFPISAAYSGDSTHNGSSGGHKLITPKCVSTDPSKPCPNSIGLTFPNSPSVNKQKINAIVQCGATSVSAATLGRDIIARDLGSGSICHVGGLGGAAIADLFKALSFDEAKAVGALISDKDASKDSLLYLMKNAYQVETEERWKIIQETNAILLEIQQDVVKNKNSIIKDKTPWEEYIRAPFVIDFRKTTKPKFDKALKSALLQIDIKPNKQKNINFKLPPRVGKLISYYKEAGVASIPLYITLNAKQDKRKGKATITETVDFVIK